MKCKGDSIKDDKSSNVVLWCLVGAALVIVALCIIVTVAPIPRDSKAKRYDLECSTELRENPLEECKE